MKIKISALTGLATAMLVFCTGATLTATAGEAPVLTEKPARPDYYPWTVGIGGGSEGIFGGSVEWRFSDHVGLRVAAGYTEWSMGDTSIAGINYNVKVRLAGEPLTLDVYPWTKHSFHISFGWLFNQNEMTGSAGESGFIIIDGNPVPIQPGRSLNMKIQQQPLNPYLGIGGNFLYFDHAHRWALGGELGVIYSGDPKVSITRSGPPDPVIDAALNGAAARLQSYAEQFKFLPVVTLKLTYSF